MLRLHVPQTRPLETTTNVSLDAVLSKGRSGRFQLLAGRARSPGPRVFSGPGDAVVLTLSMRQETFAQITETCSDPTAEPSFATVTAQAGLPSLAIAYADDSVRIFVPAAPVVR